MATASEIRKALKLGLSIEEYRVFKTEQERKETEQERKETEQAEAKTEQERKEKELLEKERPEYKIRMLLDKYEISNGFNEYNVESMNKVKCFCFELISLNLFTAVDQKIVVDNYELTLLKCEFAPEHNRGLGIGIFSRKGWIREDIYVNDKHFKVASADHTGWRKSQSHN